jgi:hypothetical protein
MNILSGFNNRFKNILHYEEVEREQRLQWFLWAILFLLIFDLNKLAFVTDRAVNEQVCWPFWLTCYDWQLPALPESYFMGGVMAVLLALMTGALMALLRQRWWSAMLLLLPVLAFKSFYHFIFRDTGQQNFEFFMQIPAWTFFLSRDKLRSLRWMWATLYFFAASVKFSDGWILGTYFSSMKLGLPGVPRELIPLATNLVIIFEIFFSYGLVSRHPWYRMTSFYLWIAFHFYSVFLVGYYYPVRCLTYLVVLFLPTKDDRLEDFLPLGFIRRPMWLSVLFFFYALHIAPLISKKDRFYTFERLGYSFFMIDGNHQCRIQIRYFDKQGKLIDEEKISLYEPRTRCSPTQFVQKIKRRCRRESFGRAEFILDHSLNGGPFYRIVDQKNACDLPLSIWRDHEWIRDPSLEIVEVVGWPSKNQISPSGNFGGSISQKDGRQTLVIKNDNAEVLITLFKHVYLFFWFAVGLHIFYYIVTSGRVDSLVGPD